MNTTPNNELERCGRPSPNVAKERGKWFRMPYWRAMKAYAYAGKSFEYTMERLSKMEFETPRPDVSRHLPHYRRCKSAFKGYRAQAMRRSRSLEFSSSEIEALGLDPLYTWIHEGEQGSPNDKCAFVQGVVEDLSFVRLRKIVSIAIRLGIPAEKIQEFLRRPSPVAWKAYHIEFYRRFFWDIAGMSQEAKLAYLAITSKTKFMRGYEYLKTPKSNNTGVFHNLEETNPHYNYVRKVFSLEDRNHLMLECHLHYDVKRFPTPLDTRRCIEDQLLRASKTGNFSLIGRLAPIYLSLIRHEKRGTSRLFSLAHILKVFKLIRKHGLPLMEVAQPGWYNCENPELQIAHSLMNLRIYNVRRSELSITRSKIAMIGAKIVFL